MPPTHSSVTTGRVVSALVVNPDCLFSHAAAHFQTEPKLRVIFVYLTTLKSADTPLTEI